jgi:hypothetical protein
MPDHDQSNTPRLPPIKSLKDRGWVSLRTFASNVADITYPTALRWCRLEMINFVQVGGTKRIYEEEIARFIREGTLKPHPEKLAQEKAKREEYKQNAESQRAQILKRTY